MKEEWACESMRRKISTPSSSLVVGMLPMTGLAMGAV